jgi:osmotically-inducible protein OsmY
MTTETDATGIGIPITGAVRHELDISANVDASRIDVVSHDGIVRLTGMVGSTLEQRATKDTALRTKDVTTVDDQVTIDTPRVLDLTNSEVASAVDKSLDCATAIPRESIQADVRCHAVTLTGVVEWKCQKELAGHAASHVRGVRSATNEIDVAKCLSASHARELIRSAFIRSVVHDADAIQIMIRQDTVILSGTVSSSAEKYQAEIIAASSTHVSQVINQLIVHSPPSRAD